MNDEGPQASLSTTEARGILRASWIVHEFRSAGHRMTANNIAAFLAVANSPDLGPTEYAKLLGTMQPVASRWLLDLGPKGREGSEGMGLLEREPDLMNLRQVRYRLSDRGMSLAKRVGAIAMGRESPMSC